MNSKRETTSQFSSPAPVPRAGRWAVAKQFLIIFLPLLVLVGGIKMMLFSADKKSERVILETNEAYDVYLHKQAIVSDIKSTVSDLMVLSVMYKREEIFNYIEGDNEDKLMRLSYVFLAFSERKELYNQIRILDNTGMEVVKVNFNNGRPRVVPEDQLRFKGNRYYFKKTIELGQGEIYVSPFNLNTLNTEKGSIEQTLKPMIHFCTPVFDIYDQKQGIVVLSHLGEKLFHDFERIHVGTQSHTMLLNPDGFWLEGLNPEDEWGFMYKDGKNRTFGNAFPEAWQRISNNESGQFYNKDGLFTFGTVYPLLKAQVTLVETQHIASLPQPFGRKSSAGTAEAFEPPSPETKAYYWKIVTHTPSYVLKAGTLKLLSKYAIVFVYLIFILAFVTFNMARARVSHKLAGEALAERSQLRALGADIGVALVQGEVLQKMIQWCSEILQRYIEAAFVRIWTLNENKNVLELQASAGMYTHIDGPHKRVPVGMYKIGLIAKERKPYLTNNVIGDPRVHDQEWAKREGMVAFAGHPLIVEDRVIGVMAMFSRKPLTETTLKTLESVADELAIGIERKRVVERQARLLNELENTNQELKDFAYIVSHDLKAPLRAISSLGNWISTDYADKFDEDGKEQMTLLLSRVTRMHNLIDGILRYSRVGRSREQIVDVDLNKLVAEVIDMVAPPENIEITVENKLPSIMCEKARIGQVFQNILSNAVKFMNKPKGEIKISCVEDDGCWKFCVVDNGPGIEEKYFEKIFLIFQTLSPRDEVESTGIGLTVVKKIIDMYGGKIWVESKAGHGSTFFFTLPKNLKEGQWVLQNGYR